LREKEGREVKSKNEKLKLKFNQINEIKKNYNQIKRNKIK